MRSTSSLVSLLIAVALLFGVVSAANQLKYSSNGKHLAFNWLTSLGDCSSSPSVNSTRTLNYTVLFYSNAKNKTEDFSYLLFLSLSDVNSLQNETSCPAWASRGLAVPNANKTKNGTFGLTGSQVFTFTPQEPAIWIVLLNCNTSELNADVTLVTVKQDPVKFDCKNFKRPVFAPIVPHRSKKSDWWIAIVILAVLVILGGIAYGAYWFFYERHHEEHTPLRPT